MTAEELHPCRMAKDGTFHKNLLGLMYTCALSTNIPAPLLDVLQPSELEPRESEVADAPLLDSADPVAEQRSSPRRRLSRSLDVEMASLFWVSEGSLHFRDRKDTTDHRAYSDRIADSIQEGEAEPRECNGWLLCKDQLQSTHLSFTCLVGRFCSYGERVAGTL